MLTILFELVLGCAILLFGGDWLVNGSTALALRYRISPLVIGMTIVAFGTSAPELLVSLIAAVKGSSGIALGNVVGSNIANIGLILGLTAIIAPIPAEGKSLIAHGTVMIAASVLMAVLAVTGNGMTRAEGFAMFLMLLVFVYISVQKGHTKDSADSENRAEPKVQQTAFKSVIIIVLSCIGLAVGADMLVDSATALAKMAGVSERVIGLTIVALGTSLPELAASVIAALKKQTDISIGNVIGSNIFNILCVLGLAVSVKPIQINAGDYCANFGVMMLLMLILMAAIVIYRKAGRLLGILLFSLYVAFAIALF